MTFKLNNTYTAIFVIAAAASIMQLGLLSNGLFARVNHGDSTPVQASKQVVSTPTQPVTVASNSASKSFTPVRIEIQKMGIDLPVVSVPLVNGTWAVNDKVANYAEGTSLINDKTGNVGIYAHNRVTGFTKIKQLLTGNDIIVYGKDQKATYRVVSTSVVKPTDVKVFDQTKDPRLTLLTCDGTFSTQRYIVKAKLVKIEKLIKHSN